MSTPAPPKAGITAPCLGCQTPMTFVMPIPRIFNAVDVSSVCFVHSRPDRCSKCGAMFLPMIEGFDESGAINFRWMPVTANKSPIVVGNTDTLKNAIAQAEFTEKLKNQGN